MLKEIAAALEGTTHTDVKKFATHVAEEINVRHSAHISRVSEARINGDNETYTGDYEKGYFAGVQDARLAIIAVLADTVDDVQHRGDKHHEKHFKDGIE